LIGGGCEEALELLKPLAEWDCMHVLDAAALCNLLIRIEDQDANVYVLT
jgi:hypothetical protein